jgi:uncharacterized membrane protein
LLTAGAWVIHRIGAAPGRWWFLAAFILYTATLGITRRYNIPLNVALDEAGDPEHNVDLAAVRERFERPWLRWNHVRMFTSLAAFGCIIGALLQQP